MLSGIFTTCRCSSIFLHLTYLTYLPDCNLVFSACMQVCVRGFVCVYVCVCVAEYKLLPRQASTATTGTTKSDATVHTTLTTIPEEGKEQERSREGERARQWMFEGKVILKEQVQHFHFLGPRGPLRTPSSARPSVRPSTPKIEITSKAL